MVFILIYIALVIVRPQEYPVFADAPPPVLSGTLAVALVAWLIAGRKSFAQPQYGLLFAFFVMAAVSVAFNGGGTAAIEEATQFAPAVIAFVLLANAITTQGRMLLTMRVFVLCSCVLALHGVFQVQDGIGWTGMPLVQDDGRIQYVGIFSDPNDLGLLFVSVLPMAFYLSTRGGYLGLARIVWLGAAALLLYGIFLTNSRGAILAVAFTAGAWLWLRRGLVTAVVGAGVGLAALSLLPSRIQELDASEESAAGRVDAWYEGLQMFQAQPIFGVGAGNFTDHNYLTAHNSFVLVLAETGFIGYTIWLAFVGYCFWMMFTLCRFAPNGADTGVVERWKAEREISATLLMVLCAFFAAAFFLSRSYVIVLYLMAALVVAQYSMASEGFSALPQFSVGRDLGRWIGLSIGTIGLFYVIVRVLL